MKKILYLILFIAFAACEKNSRIDEINEKLKNNALIKLNNFNISMTDSVKGILIIDVYDTTSYPTLGYTELMASHLVGEIHTSINNFDSVVVYHTLINWDRRFRIGYSVDVIHEVMNKPKINIISDVTNYMLFNLSREEFIQIEFSIESSNSYFTNYSFHSYLPQLIINCVQKCDTSSIEYKAMTVQGILAFNMNDEKRLGLFNVVKQHCQGTQFSINDVPPFKPNLEYIEKQTENYRLNH